MCMSREDRNIAREENLAKARVLWVEFNQKYPTEESALEAVCKGAPNNNNVCSFCNGTMLLSYSKRQCACPHCGNRKWLTADSWLHGVKKLKVHVGTLWLMQQGVMVTPSLLKELSGGCISTCVNVVKKVALAMVDVLKEQLLAQTVELRELFIHRSTETPKSMHPASEQDEIERECGEAAKREADFLARIEELTRFSEGDFEQCEISAEDVEATAISEKESSSTTEEVENTTALKSTEGVPDNDVDGDGEKVNEEVPCSPKDMPCLPNPEWWELTVLDKHVLIALTEGELRSDHILRKVPPLEHTGLLGGSLVKLMLLKLVVAEFGDRWRLAVRKTVPRGECTDDRLNSMLQDFKDHVQLFKDGISRKNVQLHFAIFWIHKFHESLDLEWFFAVMHQRGRIHPLELRNFASPLLINIFGFDASAFVPSRTDQALTPA